MIMQFGQVILILLGAHVTGVQVVLACLTA